MTLEATVTDLVNATTALHDAVRDKKTVLDNAAQQAAASLTATQSKQAEATASAAAAAASAATATSQAAEITAFKTAATALNTSTTATQAVTNLLPDMLAKKDPARHPFRNKLPSLVLDFERQKAHRYSDSTGFAETPLSSLMTFVRNSTATYTGPDGVLRTAGVNQPRYDYDPVTGECKGLLIEEQRTNLLTYSNRFDNSVWVKTNVTTVPNSALSVDGTLTAASASTSSASSTISTSVSVTANGAAYCASVYLKWLSGSTSVKIRCALTGGTAVARYLTINAQSGAFIASDSTYTITPVGNNWYRVSVIITNNSTNTALTLQVYPSGDAVNTNLIGMCCAQLEAGAFPTSYIPTPATFTGRTSTATYLDVNGVVQTAGVGVARSAAYGYDADGVLRPIGLLLENRATNLLRHSSNCSLSPWFSDVYGAAGTPTITPTYSTAPDGTLTANRVQMALNGGSTIGDWCSIAQPVTTVAGSTYTESVWLKTADGSTKTVQLSFNGDTPQLLTVTGTWKRFSATTTAIATNRGFRLALRGTTGTSDSADLLVWGAQHELGNYATSYIPTTTAQVTRAADTSTSAQATRAADSAIIDQANTAPWLKEKEGSIVSVSDSNFIAGAGNGASAVCSLDDGSTSNRISLFAASGSNTLTEFVSGGVVQASLQQAGVSVGVKRRSALSYIKNSFSLSSDGSVSVTDNSGTVPNVKQLQLGKVFSDGQLNGHIKRLTYYPTAFTNEELQVLTSA